MLRYLSILFCILSIQTQCAFFMRKAKISKATSLITSKRFKLPLARTLVYKMISPKHAFAELALAQHATEFAIATQSGVTPNIYSLNPDTEYFVHIQNPNIKNPHYYLFDSAEDIKKIVEATDPEHPRRSFRIDGFADCSTLKSWVIKHRSYEDLYKCFGYKSYQTVLKWYAINKKFVQEKRK